MSIPIVFISYSHDSQEHKKWILKFATRLRNNGIDAVLDQWELKAGDDLPHFMETNLVKANFILMICTERYVEKANGGSGGVGYEKMIITSNLISQISQNKILPIIRQNSKSFLPTFLKTKLFINFSIDDDFEVNFDDLLRRIHNSPIYEKPEVGNNPFKNINEDDLLKNDALLDLIERVVSDYEDGEDYTAYEALIEDSNNSRIMTDFLIKRATDQNLIHIGNYGELILTDEGKLFAINKKLL